MCDEIKMNYYFIELQSWVNISLFTQIVANE